MELVEPPYLTQPGTPCGTAGTSISYTDRDTLWKWWNWCNFHISHRQKHPVKLVKLIELSYLTQLEKPCGTKGTSISHTARDTKWNWWEWWNFYISHSQRQPMELAVQLSHRSDEFQKLSAIFMEILKKMSSS